MREILDEDAARRLIESIRPVPGARLGEWVLQARCVEVDPELWFPPQGSPGLEAKAICAACEVREPCLAYAVEADEENGIWGGLNRAERLRVRAAMQRDSGGRPGKGAALPAFASGVRVLAGRGGVLAGAAAFAGAAFGQLGVGGGQCGAVGVVAVLGDLAADVVEEVLCPVAAEALADALVGIPQALGDAQVHTGRVVCHLELSFRRGRDGRRGKPIVLSGVSAILCLYTVFSLAADGGVYAGTAPGHLEFLFISFHFLPDQKIIEEMTVMTAETETVTARTPERACKRPGCGKPVPPGNGRGRTRVFCSDGCARGYHNDSRVPGASVGAGADQDPLAALEPLLRQASVLAKAACDQAEGLDPARVRVEIADAEAARRRAEAAVVTAQARQAEAESEAEALAKALEAAREDKAVAEAAAAEAGANTVSLEARIEAVRREADERVAAATADLHGQAAEAREEALRARRELDQAIAGAREVRAAADAEIARARQAEADARQETQRVRDDAAREREALKAGCEAQLQGQQALTDAERARAERAEAQLEAERADRRQLTTRITAGRNSRTEPGPEGKPAAKKPASRAPASAPAGVPE